jgi:hypothetical protein
MPRYLITIFLLLALTAASAFAADKSPGGNSVVHDGGLMCFSITPARYDGHELPSCNALCAAKDAACTAVQGTQIPENCERANADGASQQCRCCALEHR